MSVTTAVGQRVGPFLAAGLCAVLYAVALAAIAPGVLVVRAADALARPPRDPRRLSGGRGRGA